VLKKQKRFHRRDRRGQGITTPPGRSCWQCGSRWPTSWPCGVTRSPGVRCGLGVRRQSMARPFGSGHATGSPCRHASQQETAWCPQIPQIPTRRSR